MLFAGYGTTASSLSCLLQALFLNPEVENWLQDGLTVDTTSPRLDAMVLVVMRLTPPVGGFFWHNFAAINLAGVAIPEGSVVQVVLSPMASGDDGNLATFRPQRHLDRSFKQTMLPSGGGERVCLGKALAELEIRLMAEGKLNTVNLQLQPGENLALQQIPSPTPKGRPAGSSSSAVTAAAEGFDPVQKNFLVTQHRLW